MQTSLAHVQAVSLRRATLNDLPAVNCVINAAIQTWKLPERVKRLATPSYHYKELDLQHMTIMLRETVEAGILGVVAWEEAETRDLPAGQSGLLLHGIFVDPAAQRQGIGSQLLACAEDQMREQGLQGLLVKAQADAVGFFLTHGLEKLPAQDQQRDFENRFWKPATA